MAKDRYVAYVGTYTHGSSVGIHIFDVDAEKGKMVERKVVPINNPSYLPAENFFILLQMKVYSPSVFYRTEIWNRSILCGQAACEDVTWK